MWTSVLLRPVRPGQRSLHVGSVSPCPSCSCLSLASPWHAAERVCDPPQPHTLRPSTPGLRCTPSGSGSARQARRTHREFSAWRCCHRFLLSDDRAALHHRDSDHERVLSEHPRFKAMAKPHTGARVSLGIGPFLGDVIPGAAKVDQVPAGAYCPQSHPRHSRSGTRRCVLPAVSSASFDVDVWRLAASGGKRCQCAHQASPLAGRHLLHHTG